jgi:hypothetical protein
MKFHSAFALAAGLQFASAHTIFTYAGVGSTNYRKLPTINYNGFLPDLIQLSDMPFLNPLMTEYVLFYQCYSSNSTADTEIS